MPSFSLFPTPSRHSHSSSYSSITESTFSSSARCSSPAVSSPISDSESINDPFSLLDKKRLSRKSLSKPLPDVPSSVLECRLNVPASFHPTRRAPLPPTLRSWLDVKEENDEEDNYEEIDSILSEYGTEHVEPCSKPSTSPPPAPPPPPPTSSAVAVWNHSLEKEIMKMLVPNEVEKIAKIAGEKPPSQNNGYLGGIFGKLRRSFTMGRAAANWSDKKRPGSYFDYMIWSNLEFLYGCQ